MYKQHATLLRVFGLPVGKCCKSWTMWNRYCVISDLVKLLKQQHEALRSFSGMLYMQKEAKQDV